MKKVGYWRAARKIATPVLVPEDVLPWPADLVDPTVPAAAREAMVLHLMNAPEGSRYRGFSCCRICGCVNGSTERSDGTYTWPDGFAHYVEAHGVWPDLAFVDHVFAPKLEQGDR